ncbi:MAG: Crp/Fnr family transcriptional regulator, partial [Gemmatimonadota bacterium]
MTVDPHTLRALPLFRDLGSASLELVSRGAVIRAFRADSTVWHVGTEANGLHILLEGSVRAVRYRGGREVVVHRAAPGATLGEVPLFDGEGYPARLVAETDARFVVLRRVVLEELLARDPAVAWTLLGGLARRVRELAQRLEAATADPVRTRLAAHLLERARGAGDGSFTLGMTQEALARDLGTVREVVA